MSKKRSNISVEMIRILATFIVIMVHTASWYVAGGKMLNAQAMIYAFLQDAVPVFWYIMGMFLFREGNTFKKNIVRTVTRVLLPALVLVVVVAVLAPWLEGKSSFVSCLSLAHVDWLKILGSIGRGSASGLPLGGHLWFVFSYAGIILWFPLLRYVCVDEPNANRVRRYLLALVIAAEAVSDLQQFVALPTGNLQVFTILDSNLLYVVLGYELSLRLETLRRNRKLVMAVGFGAFVLANAARFLITRWFFDRGNANTAFMHIEHLISVVSSLGLMSALLMIEPRGEKLNRLILKLSGYSFPVYLLHRAVYTRLNAWGVRALVYDALSANAITKVVATVSYGLIVFAVSFALAVVCRIVFRFGKTIVLGKQSNAAAA